VLCVAGANGLGKSTLIAAVNYGLTGRVPDPEQSFKSPEEYYEDTKQFTEKYFDGRIAELQRSSAEVAIEFSVAGCTYRITRGLFEPNQLRQLTIVDAGGPDPIPTGLTSGSQLQNYYADHIAHSAGLEDFPQFVFLQLFLLTFDERRHLAFWDATVLEQLLFLAFGVDATVAQRAQSLRRIWEKQDSLSRNRSWQASEIRKKLKDLEAIMQQRPEVDDELAEQHELLNTTRDAAAQRAAQTDGELRDHRLRFNDLSSQYTALLNEYGATFAQRSRKQRSLQRHPLITSSINEHRCELCGNTHHKAIAVLRERTSENSCPLCGSEVATETDNDEEFDLLIQVDNKLAQVKRELGDESGAIERLEKELQDFRAHLNAVELELADFERSNEEAITPRVEGNNLQATVNSYRLQIRQLVERRDDARAKRDKARTEWRVLQRVLAEAYAMAEVEFVGRFSTLAYEFLGLDVHVSYEANAGQTSLLLEVEGTPRRLEHQLSESQRFFVDIALRMALAQFMSSKRGPAMMVIDTPEGSLDAAYESRAGEMFARFVSDDHRILMTANINTSQLLLRLAERCGRKRMKLVRMTQWAELSEVQLAEESLFDEAFEAIEERLDYKSRNDQS